jgi:hypothetical protein
MSHTPFVPSLGLLCPWLVLLLALQALSGFCGVRRRGWPRLLILALLAAGLLQIPISGFSIAQWVRGISADFSIPWIGLLAIAAWEHEFRRKVFSTGAWIVTWVFGALAGIALYPLALGVSSFDPYEWGWSFSALFVISAVLTTFLIWNQNRFGVLLLLAVVAYQLRGLESANYWDYLVDPVYCLVSVGALGWQLLIRQQKVPSPSPS